MRRRRGRLFEAQRRQWRPLARRQARLAQPPPRMPLPAAAFSAPCPAARAPNLPLPEGGEAKAACKRTSPLLRLLDEGRAPAYLAQQARDNCQVYGLLVANRFNGVHPHCLPSNKRLPQTLARFSKPVSLCCVTPPRSVWAQCLARSLAKAVAHNTVVAWRNLFMLVKSVRDQAAQYALKRCRRWLAPAAVLHARRGARPPLLRASFPLGPAAHQPVPDLHADQVLAAACSFRRGSAAGPSGLRGDHLVKV